MVPSKLDPNDPITVTRTDRGPVVIVHVSGEIDMATSDTMAEHVLGRLAERPATLVIDLSGVAFLGSAGLSVLIEASQQAEEGVTTLRIVATAAPVLRPLEISGLIDLLPVCRSLSEAMQGLTDPPAATD
jgi:anti-sigma B factor antagonist